MPRPEPRLTSVPPGLRRLSRFAISALPGMLLAVVSAFTACGRGGGAEVREPPVPAAAAAAPVEVPSVPAVRIAGDVLWDLDDGDFLFPRFSPDGSTLAFASSIVRDEVEGTEVFLLDLATGKRRRLLDADDAAKLGVYKAFVGDLAWSDRSVLWVDVYDGDVGGTRLTYDTRQGDVIKSVHTEADESEDPPLPSELEPAVPRVAALLPDLNASQVRAAMGAFGAVVEDEGAILDPSRSGSDVRLVDFRRGVTVPLEGWPTDAGQLLGGGFIPDGGAVYSIGGRDEARVYLHGGGTTREIARFRAKCSYLRAAGGGPGTPAFFVLRLEAASVPGDNQFLMFDRGRIARIEDYAGLADADVDRHASVVAYSRWEGDVRHIAVRRLHVPRP